MENKGFTLVEMVIVVVLIGILASIALPQYQKAAEKARSAEARTILGRIRSAEMAYYLEYDTYTNSLSNLKISAPGYTSPCTNANFYFTYNITATASTFNAQANRCTSGGKSPAANSYYYMYTTDTIGLGSSESYIL